ncbi:MAG TPA: FmdB family zinc ribbon protein [Xanthobacteraceae bacterium]
MPLYDYRCTQCGRVTEVRHGFNDSHDAPCPACGAPLKRVFNAAPVLFKGSGFYVTDSRDSSKSRKAETAKAETKTEPEKTEGSTKAKTPSTQPKGGSSGADSAA